MDIKSILDYDPDTGEFWWKTYKRGRYMDRRADKLRNCGYRQLYIDGKWYRAHRIAFLWMTGSMPDMVDHINQDKADNRWCNLRPTTQGQNQLNAKRTAKAGVSRYKKTGRWQAYVGRNWLGVFDTPEEARAARNLALEKMI